MATRKAKDQKAAAEVLVNKVLTDPNESCDGLNKFFSAHDHTEDAVTDSIEKKTAKIEQNKKKPFSFRADQDQVRVWRIYAQTAEMKMEDLCSAAINEYIQNHALEGRKQTIFELSVNK